MNALQLDIVIPALNEEASIETVARRCLEARERLVAETPLTAVTVTVVDDGSTDRTGQLAKAMEPDITVVTHPHNRGYGAAIKSGFAARNGDLVGFLDGDGTCDPLFFVDLVNELLENDLSVCIGSRLGPDSKMPPVRRLGNRIYRTLLNWIARTSISDTASGMRVIRRDALPILDPLPDGLHYTPTMSCRAALDARLTIGEVPMSYQEREGRSKLNVVKDGVRFLRTIVDVGLTYQPMRFVAWPGVALLVGGILLGLEPAFHYLAAGEVNEGAIYRLMFVLMLCVGGANLLGFGLISELIVGMIHPRSGPRSRLAAFLDRRVRQAYVAGTGMVLGLMAVWLLGEPVYQRLTTGQVSEHWSRIILGIFAMLLCIQVAGFLVMLRTVRQLWLVQSARNEIPPLPEG